MIRQRSISRRLIAIVLLLELVASLIMVAITFLYERRVEFRAFDVMLRGRADSLLGAVGDAEDTADSVILDLSSVTPLRRELYRVVEDGKGVLGQSAEWPLDLLRDSRVDLPGYLRVQVHGRAYRFVEVHGVRVVDPGSKGGGVRHAVTVLYGVPTDRVWHEVWESVRFYAVASLLLLMTTGFVMAYFLRRSLAPLHELAEEAGRVSAQQWQFATPERARATRELAPLCNAIEATLARLQQSFEQQERFTSDAAHELKTDVAIVKSSIQLLAMRSRTAAEYEAGLDVCLTDCERLEKTVQEMLTLARTRYVLKTGDDVSPICDLALCVQEARERLASFAEVRRVKVVVDGDQRVTVGVEDKECMLLCSNLLHNALLHSNPHTEVHLKLSRENGFVVLRVEDVGGRHCGGGASACV